MENRRHEKIPQQHSAVIRGPSQMAFDITNRCNFRCLHCYNSSGDNDLVTKELSDNEVVDFITDVAFLKPFNMCFCGGEPLLREKLLIKCAEILSGVGTHVSCVTNGFLLTAEKAKRMVGAGICNIQVSLDGADAKNHERLRGTKGAFARAVKAIETISGLNIETGVAFSPTRFNVSEFLDVYEICRRMRAKELRIQPLMILGRARENSEQLIPTSWQYRYLIHLVQELKMKGDGVRVDWGDPVDHLIRFKGICRHCVNYIDVRADGSIIASPYIPIVVGSLRKYRFSQYWEAGLARLWELPEVKEMAEGITCTQDFQNQDVFSGKDTVIDLIDGKYFKEVYP